MPKVIFNNTFYFILKNTFIKSTSNFVLFKLYMLIITMVIQIGGEYELNNISNELLV